MEEMVTVTYGETTTTVNLTPEDVEVLKAKLRQKQERMPELGWTMADVIAYYVLARGIDALKIESPAAGTARGSR